MANQFDTPAPHDFERKVQFLVRWSHNASVERAYPSLSKRRAAGEHRWTKAKKDSLVSITTAMGEVLLFGRL